MRGGRQEVVGRPLTCHVHPIRVSRIVNRDRLINRGGVVHHVISTGVLSSVVLCNPPKVNGADVTDTVTKSARSTFHRLGTTASAGGSLRVIIRRTGFSNRIVLLLSRIRQLSGPGRSFLLPRLRDNRIVLVNTAARGPCVDVDPTVQDQARVFRLGPLAARSIVRTLRHTVTSRGHKLKGRGVLVRRSTLLRFTEDAVKSIHNSLGTLRLTTLSAGPSTSKAVRVALSVTRRYVRGGTLIRSGGNSTRCSIVSTFRGSVHNDSISTTVRCLTELLRTNRLLVTYEQLVIYTCRSVNLNGPRTITQAILTIRTTRGLNLPRTQVPLTGTIISLTLSPGSGSTCLTLSDTLTSIHTKGSNSVPSDLHSTRCDKTGGLNHNVNCRCPRSFPSR